AECFSGVAVVLDQKDTQRFGRLSRDASGNAARSDPFFEHVEAHFKRRALIAPAALNLDLPVMQVDQVFGDGQTETQTAKSAGDSGIALFERSKQFRLLFGLDANSAVSNGNFEVVAVVVGSTDLDLAAVCAEFYRIVNQVPKQLYNSNPIAPNLMPF